MDSVVLPLVERLVVAMEAISHDVKDISSHVSDLSWIVSHFLHQKRKEGGGGDSFPSAAPAAPEEASAENTYFSQYHQGNESSVSRTDELHLRQTPLTNVATLKIENPHVLPSFTGVIKTEGESDYENGESFIVHNTCDRERNNGQFTGVIKTEGESNYENGESLFVHNTYDSERNNGRVSTAHITIYPEAPVSAGFKKRNSEETNDTQADLLKRCLNHVGNSPPSCYQESIASTACLEEGVRVEEREQNGDQQEICKRQCSIAGETSSRVQENETTCKGEMENSSAKKRSKTKKCYSCDTCGKYCRDGHALQIHMRSHSREKPFGCALCSRWFATRSHLVVHLRVHSGEKPFKCNVCGKMFSQSSYLTSHMRSHTGDKPFSCQVCEKAFSDRTTLRKHLRVHTSEKPYRCTECGKEFSLNGNMSKHMRNFHGVEK